LAPPPSNAATSLRQRETSATSELSAAASGQRHDHEENDWGRRGRSIVTFVREHVPAGTVTFLYSDLEDSTQQWDETPSVLAPSLEINYSIVRRSIEQHGGFVFATRGDGFAAAFSTAGDAADAAVEIQRKLLVELDAVPFKVRIGLHTGEATERDRNSSAPR